MNTIRPDYSVLNYKTYNDYIKSFITIDDERYIQNTTCTKNLVKLGYRTNTRIYEENEFTKVKEKTLEMLNPVIKTRVLCSGFMQGNDPGLLALAEREKSNLLQKVSTIIFLVVRQPNGFDISGYLDYASSLRNFNLNLHGSTNWKGIFEGTSKLRPRPSHLSFYDLQKKFFCYNDSENYQTMHVGQSLIFKHKGDHQMIRVDTKPGPIPTNVKRTSIHSPQLGTIVFYDHIVRKPV